MRTEDRARVENWVTHSRELEISHRLRERDWETISSMKAGVFVPLIIATYIRAQHRRVLSRYLWASDRKEKKTGTVSQKPRVGAMHLVL